MLADNLHEVPPVCILGNEIYVALTGELTENGPYAFVLIGDSSFRKILKF